MPEPLPASVEPRQLLRDIHQLRTKNAWDRIAALGERLPDPLSPESLPVADEVAFALGQLRQHDRAIALLEHAYPLAPTHRRASALAYLHYSALLDRGSRGKRERGNKPEAAGGDASAERLKNGFRRWIEAALRFAPTSIKDLYRLGIFEAQVEAAHDKVALRAFLQALRAYDALDAAERERRHDLRKYYVRALYAGARSALRLEQLPLARKLSFACIREDRERDHVEPVHKLGLAARICLAGGELDHAERAARAALDAKGPPRRDHLFGHLAEIARRRGDLEGATRWIDGHVRPERRSAALWRQLGDIRAEAGDTRGAEGAWRSALLRDRTGRHLTLVRLGELQAKRGELREAERSFQDALAFRRRMYLSDEPRALEGLAALAEARGRLDEARAARDRLAKCGPPEEQPLAVVAGNEGKKEGVA